LLTAGNAEGLRHSLAMVSAVLKLCKKPQIHGTPVLAMEVERMIKIPYTCPRGREDCISLSLIQSDCEVSFFCCGENNGENLTIKEDIYTVCFKGEFDDTRSHFDKLDLMHNAAVLVQALAVVQAAPKDEKDWSAWGETKQDEKD